MELGERVLGKWAVNYLPPAGGRYPGPLQVTNLRILFVAEVDIHKLQPLIVGTVDSAAVAYALDLDPCHVTYEAKRLCLSIPKSHIDCITPDGVLLDNCVRLTLKNNGSVHLFERGLLPVNDVVRAIRESVN